MRVPVGDLISELALFALGAVARWPPRRASTLVVRAFALCQREPYALSAVNDGKLHRGTDMTRDLDLFLQEASAHGDASSGLAELRRVVLLDGIPSGSDGMVS